MRPRRSNAPRGGEILTDVEILRWAHGGEGVAVPDGGPLQGRIVFASDVVPGDVVDLALSEVKERWARGRVVRRSRDSAARVPVPCAIQGRCGGCPWMPGDAAAQADSRRKILEGELKKRLALTDADVADKLVMLPAPAAFGYRQRVRFTFDVAAGRVRLGFLGKKSHELVDAPRCEVADERINAALPALRERLAALARGGRVQGRVTLLAGDEGVAGWIEIPAGLDVGPGYTNDVTFGPLAVTLHLGDFAQRLSPSAFAQANAAVTGQMLAVLEGWARAARDEVAARGEVDPWAVELFAGGGTMTMALWRAGWRVTAYEVAEAARAGFEATRAAMHVSPERGVWHAADLGLGLPWPAPAASPALVVLDPPRTGAAEMMTWVRASGAHTVVYVSCDLATGLRDLRTLMHDGAYVINAVVACDMFPHSGHQEIMVRIVRAAPTAG